MMGLQLRLVNFHFILELIEVCRVLCSTLPLARTPQGVFTDTDLQKWLKTDLGGADSADLDVSTGVDALKDLILSSNQSVNGKFLNIKVQGWEHIYNGEEIPW